MKKVHDKALEAKIKGIIKESKEPEIDIVNLLRVLQDASGVKICQNVTVGDPAYKEVN